VFVYPPSKTLLDDQKRLNRPEEVEQYFSVYGFYNVQSKKYNTKTKGRMRRRRTKIYSTLAARRKNNIHTE
jgi:hypothetical protein